MNTNEFEATFTDKSRMNYQVYLVLKEPGWHCRECEYVHVGSSQIAGGGGIQGLQRGTKSRPGMVIESDNHLCARCERKTRHDRWQGSFSQGSQASSMPPSFVRRVITLLGSRDVVDNVERQPSELTVDHKLPMLRWNEQTEIDQTAYAEMTDDDIRERFQLLKKSNGTVSHNLLKSRACERCFSQNRRGQPLGIDFFYEGGRRWIPSDKRDPSGCIGCGWYDFALWREKLNERLRNPKQ